MFMLNSVNSIVFNPSDYYINYTPFIVENIQFKYNEELYTPESAISTIAAPANSLGTKVPFFVTPFYMAKAAQILSDGLRTYQLENEKHIDIQLVTHENKFGRSMFFIIDYKVKGKKTIGVNASSDGTIEIYENDESYMVWEALEISERNNNIFLNNAKEARAEILNLLGKEDPREDFYAPIDYSEKVANKAKEKKSKEPQPIVRNVTTITIPAGQYEVMEDGKIKINLSIVLDR